MRRAWWCVLLGALALCACNGEEPVRVRGDSGQQVLPEEDQGGRPDVAPEADLVEEDADAPEVEPDAVELPAQVARVETRLEVAQVKAGDPARVTCEAQTEAGEPVVTDVAAEVTVTPLAGVGQGEDALALVPTRAGRLSVTCALPALGLIDPSPAALEVLPGAPHAVIATLEERFVEAGGEVGVRCEVYDAWGNVIEGLSPQVRTDAVGAGLEVLEGGRLLARRAGIYAVSCQVDGAQESFADGLEVIPGPPAGFALRAAPAQEVYAPGQVVEVVTVVTDAYDNPIPGAPVALSSSPAAPRLGERRLRLESEGTYTVVAAVEGLPEGAPPLGGELSLTVNGVGPRLQCTEPANGAMLTRSGDGRLTLRGTVADAHGVSLVTVNGQRGALSVDGSFEAELQSEFGINLVELTATDSYGVRSSRTCAFLAAEQWISGANDYLGGGVSLRLAQSGIDDANRSGNINSLGDLLHIALNSAQLRSQIHGALQGANPLVETYCAQDVCAFGACLCVYRLGVRYNNLELNGPHEVSLSLVDGGLRARATVRGLGLDVSVLGTTPVSGWVRTESVFVDLTSDLSLQNGRPSVRLRGINEVRVGSISTDIRGLLGWVVDLIVPLFEGLIRTQVQNQIRSFISSSFNGILDGTVSGLDVSSLGSSISVPSLSGAPISLGFGVNFSSLSVNGGRALFGVGTRFTGPSGRPRGRGAPLPSGSALRDPQTGRAVAATVHQGVLNHALHTLWVAGMFDADLGGDTLGAPEEVSIQLRTDLPPVLTFVDGKALLSLGAARVRLVWPGFLEEALTLEVGARAEASVSLVGGEELRFGGIRVTALALSSPEVPLDPVVEAILEDLVRRLVQRVVDQSLNDALPALPIPSFTIPDSLGQYGLPRNTALGLRSPTLQLADPHVVLESDFGTVMP
jgi:hypothetical protein